EVDHGDIRLAPVVDLAGEPAPGAGPVAGLEDELGRIAPDGPLVGLAEERDLVGLLEEREHGGLTTRHAGLHVLLGHLVLRLPLAARPVADRGERLARVVVPGTAE